jgi:hypothetical protein
MPRHSVLGAWLPASSLAAVLLMSTVARADGPGESPEPAPPPQVVQVVIETPPAALVLAMPLPPRHRPRWNVAMVAGGGVTATAGVVALLFGGLGFVADAGGNDMVTHCHEHLGCHSETLTAQDRAAEQTINWVSVATGAVLVGTGVTLFLYGLKDRSHGGADATATLRAFATPREAGLRLTF